MIVWLHNLHQYFCNVQKNVHKLSISQKKNMETRTIKIFSKMKRQCKVIITQKGCEQDHGDIDTEDPKLTNHFHITLLKYLHYYEAKYKELYLYVGLYGNGLFNFRSYVNLLCQYHPDLVCILFGLWWPYIAFHLYWKYLLLLFIFSFLYAPSVHEFLLVLLNM